MALFNKKKNKEKEFLELGEDLDDDTGSYGPASEKNSEKSSDLPTLPGAAPSTPNSFVQKDMEILKSKLDALKSEIGALNSRVNLLEQKAHIKKETEMSEKYGTKPSPGWHY